MQITCPNAECRRSLTIPPHAVGKKVHCSYCQTQFVVPSTHPASDYELNLFDDDPGPTSPGPPTRVLPDDESVGRRSVRLGHEWTATRNGLAAVQGAAFVLIGAFICRLLMQLAGIASGIATAAGQTGGGTSAGLLQVLLTCNLAFGLIGFLVLAIGLAITIGGPVEGGIRVLAVLAAVAAFAESVVLGVFKLWGLFSTMFYDRLSVMFYVLIDPSFDDRKTLVNVASLLLDLLVALVLVLTTVMLRQVAKRAEQPRLKRRMTTMLIFTTCFGTLSLTLHLLAIPQYQQPTAETVALTIIVLDTLISIVLIGVFSCLASARFHSRRR